MRAVYGKAGRSGYAAHVPIRRLFGRGSPQPGDSQPDTPQAVPGRTPPEDRAAALASALGASVAPGPAFERQAAASGMDLSLLWSLGRPVRAAALVVPHPGRTGLLLCTMPRDTAHVQSVALTVRAALAGCGAAGIRLVQALTSPHEALREAALREAGLRHLATLEYLERPIPGPPPRTAPLPAGTSIEPWDPADRVTMTQLLRRTYEGTLDCPGLSELRRDEDILDGHLGAGTFDPATWLILREHGRAIGALLLSASPPTDSVEVIYLGLAPEARGRGIGAALLAHGIRAVAQRPERTLALAVDVRNVPAMRLYQRAGFVPVRRREAWIAVPPSTQGGEPTSAPVK